MQRTAQHRAGTLEGFASRHGCNMLVWFEMHSTMDYAIQREKQLKKWNRAWKLRLIEEGNPSWHDLAVELGFDPLR
jgi:putative endonuclease